MFILLHKIFKFISIYIKLLLVISQDRLFLLQLRISIISTFSQQILQLLHQEPINIINEINSLVK